MRAGAAQQPTAKKMSGGTAGRASLRGSPTKTSAEVIAGELARDSRRFQPAAHSHLVVDGDGRRRRAELAEEINDIDALISRVATNPDPGI